MALGDYTQAGGCDSEDCLPVDDDNTPIPPPANPNGTASSKSTTDEKTTESKLVTNGFSKDPSTKETDKAKDIDEVTDGAEAKEGDTSSSEKDEKLKAIYEATELYMIRRFVESELKRRGYPVDDSKLSGSLRGIPPPPPPTFATDTTKRPAASPDGPVVEEKEESEDKEEKPVVARVRGSKRNYRRLDEL